MYLLDNQGENNPALNLALEEWAVRNLAPERLCVFFYINESAVVIGKNQNALEEVRHHYVATHNLPVLRRISGGGAVYHDLGNLNFSFLEPFAPEKVANWKSIATPILSALNGIGVPVELNYRNDIVCQGFKVSGTAQYTSRKGMLSHGTLLVQADLSRLRKALTPDSGALASKSLKSHRSSVMNLAEKYPQLPSTTTAKKILEAEILRRYPEAERFVFPPEAWEEAWRLVEEKYSTWDWNYGRSPRFTLEKEGLQLTVKRGGEIEAIALEGANFDLSPLLGVSYREEDLHETLSKIAPHAKKALLESLLLSPFRSEPSSI